MNSIISAENQAKIDARWLISVKRRLARYKMYGENKRKTPTIPTEHYDRMHAKLLRRTIAAGEM